MRIGVDIREHRDGTLHRQLISYAGELRPLEAAS
jgi:hypothetical protein